MGLHVGNDGGAPVADDMIGYDQLMQEALRGVVGPDAWSELVTWLERTLHGCWSEHGGRPIPQADGSYVVEFDERADAETCVARVRETLREHRARNGFAPELVVEWSGSGAAE